MHLTGKETTENPSERAAVSLGTIKTWPTYFRDIVSSNGNFKVDVNQNPDPGISEPETTKSVEISYKVNKKLDNKISLYCGDITMLQVDAIVNSTDATLSRSSGVAKAICKAAGPKLREKLCQFEEIESGHVVITKGYKLPAKFVIHTCAPSGKDTTERRALLLSNCYKNSLKIFMENKLKSIAFPCIATGVKGFCKEKAANVALKETREFLDQINNNGQLKNVQRIVFCVLLEEDRLIYEKLMRIYFPTTESSSQSKSVNSKTSLIPAPKLQTQSISPTKAKTDSDADAAVKQKEEKESLPSSQTEKEEPKASERNEEHSNSNANQIEQLTQIVLRLEEKIDNLSAEVTSLKITNSHIQVKNDA